MFPEDVLAQARDVLARFDLAKCKIVTAESCTGGLIAGALTEIPGSSRVVERGFVTYSNEAKIELLSVPSELIARVGAVSPEVAEAMSAGAIAHSRADVAISVTGIAGPGGETPGKPVGLVYFGITRRGDGVRHERRVFPGNRSEVRLATVRFALGLLAGVNLTKF
jgi:nicotinamide-nucleotide amidase